MIDVKVINLDQPLHSTPDSPSSPDDRVRQRLARFLALGVVAVLVVGGGLLMLPPRGWTQIDPWEPYQVVPVSVAPLLRLEDILPAVILIPCVGLAVIPVMMGAFARARVRIVGLALATAFHSIILPFVLWLLDRLVLDTPLEPPANPNAIPNTAEQSAVSELVVFIEPLVVGVMPGLLFILLSVGVGAGWLLHCIRSIRLGASAPGGRP